MLGGKPRTVPHGIPHDAGRSPRKGEAALGVRGTIGAVTKPTPWPRRTEHLLLRYAVASDLDVMLGYRLTPEVNRWMLSTAVDPARYRASWLAAEADLDDFSVVADLDGRVVGSISMELVDAPAQGHGDPRPGHPGSPWPSTSSGSAG